MVRCRIVVGFKTRVAFAIPAILKSTSFFQDCLYAETCLRYNVCGAANARCRHELQNQAPSNGYLIAKKLFKEEPFKSDDTY